LSLRHRRENRQRTYCGNCGNTLVAETLASRGRAPRILPE
jgi:hypothetical protein